MPFWRGEDSPRSAELGEAVGALCREVAEALDDPALLDRLGSEYHLDPDAARVLPRPRRPADAGRGRGPRRPDGARRDVRDPAGETGLAVLTPFGGKLHQALKLAIQARLRQRLGITAACLHGDDGLLFRLPQTDEPPLDLFDGPDRPTAPRRLIRDELGDSALFGLRFRQNAGRALLMPRPDPSKRTPLWLQRLRAKDLLQVVRQFPDFPVVIETYRECLNDDLDLPRLRSFLDAIALGGDPRRHPPRRGPLAVRLRPDLPVRTSFHVPVGRAQTRRPAAGAARRSTTTCSTRCSSRRPRRSGSTPRPSAGSRAGSAGTASPRASAEEMAETLRRLGDLSPSELAGPMRAFLDELERDGPCPVDRPARDGRARALDQRRGGGPLRVGLRRTATRPTSRRPRSKRSSAATSRPTPSSASTT